MKFLICLLCVCFLIGCQTTQSKKTDSLSESISTLGTVTEGLTNQNVSKQDLRNLVISVGKDPQVKTAVQSVTQALSVQQTGVKYCPMDGQRFDVSVKECPIHHVQLKLVE